MKPKPNYDEIHLEFYDQQEMDEYLTELKENIINDITELCASDFHLERLSHELTKIVNKRFGE
jgi:hypothetical protein